MVPVSTLGTSGLICALAGIAVVLSGCGGSSPTPAPAPACQIKDCSKVSDAQDCKEATCEECSADSVADCNAAKTPQGTKDCASQATCQDCKKDVIAHCTEVTTPDGTKDCKKQATCKTCEDKYKPFSDSQGSFCGISCDISHCKEQAPDRDAQDCSKATCKTCDTGYDSMSDAKGSYCGLSCPLDHCKFRGPTPRDAKSCKEVTTPCMACEDGYELTLNRSTLLSTGSCQPECTDEQIQNGCARHTCTDQGCDCVPGFTKTGVEVSKGFSIARFLGDTPRASSCIKEQKPTKMTFYMYRAQSDGSYPPDCTDLASASGVLFYLHNEVVKYCFEMVNAGNPPVPTKSPRHNGITRIIRYTVEVMNTAKVFGKQQGQFSHYVPFDYGKCTYNDNQCQTEWDTYGYSVGCQRLAPDPYQNRTYDDCAWYSLPGACPNKNYSAKADDAACKKKYPGGRCDSPTGDPDCTWHVINETGESIYLDELAGIAPEPFKYDPKFYLNWCLGGVGGKPGGNTEYDPKTDKGVGTSFWDQKGNATKNKERVLRLQQLFAKHYPTKDALDLQPYCDGF